MLTRDRPNAGFIDYSLSAPATRVTTAHPLSGSGLERTDQSTEWAIRFDQGLKRAQERVLGWSRDAAFLADDGFEAPSRNSILRAIEIIDRLREQVMDRVAPAATTLLNLKGVSLGSGGEISFELGSGGLAVTYRIDTDGAVTELLFKNNRLVGRDKVLP